VTPSDSEHQETLTVEVAKIVENRAAIEQAKGMLMVVYGVNATTAFNVLKWRSQENNAKLRPLAQQIVTEFLVLSQKKAHPLRSAYDNVVLTAHLRIDAHHP
jgi:AmiR/NasT family two-component response regulator